VGVSTDRAGEGGHGRQVGRQEVGVPTDQLHAQWTLAQARQSLLQASSRTGVPAEAGESLVQASSRTGVPAEAGESLLQASPAGEALPQASSRTGVPPEAGETRESAGPQSGFATP
jgi:hypothetical protein